MAFLKRYWPSLLISLLLIGAVAFFAGRLAQQGTATVDLAQVNVRKGPGLRYAVNGTAKKGTKVNIVKRKNNWLYVRYHDHQFGWIASWLVNQTQTITKVTNLAEATIVIDPGHGGSDSGALSSKGAMEKTYTLKIAQAVAKKLRSEGAHVVMTRDSDKSVSLSSRPQLANKIHADAFISFHLNSSPNDNEGSGISTYYYHSGASKTLAQDLSDKVGTLPISNRGIDFGDFLVIRDNQVPAVLMETGYINTTKDFKTISSATFPGQVADSVAAGLNTYFAKQ